MTTTISYYYPTTMENVYFAYKLGIQQTFKKDASGTPFSNLTFSLDWSLKYNMNGGECKIEFKSHSNGTIVTLTYIVSQLAGARFEAHAKHLNSCVEKMLQTKAQRVPNTI